ncbi:ABC transporter substrate-binding protein [Alkalihalobacillus sp. AL-G]|uniref:ABC transporter substrate-binding protein n=1 Tax=Alkalihalobacillus sp. AL-G TaxID=2926399 RepID=UPI00272ABA03|nr:iron-siderophore ABC transporter substrate-binding protein [Alkalihalobacillus sp. AL-G]WLD93650.1 iron-siderophore ABC transporter substrate-binding protein [Alkalihalobacillus sp. AL-G]
MALRKFSAVMLVSMFALLFILAGCGSDNGEGSAEEKDNGSKKENSYTVEHAMGETTVKGSPEKVVILTNEGTEAILSMGVKPVGAVKSWTGEPWYDHITDQMEGVEVVGTESDINLEAIAALQPDLIIGNKMRQEKHYEALSKIAPTVFSETLRGDWQINFKLYAKALNIEEKGQEVLGNYENRVKEISEKLGDKKELEISMVRFMAQDVRIYHKDSFSGIILEQLGFNRPEGQDVDDFAEKGVTKERIPEMNGDVIFYFTYETGDGEGNKVQDEWTKDPLWKNLEAVKAGKAYEVSDTIWNTAGGVIAANKMLDDIEKFFLEK